MSIENLKEYARRCAMEPELRASAKKIGLWKVEEHQELAASLGLDWTMDDMAALRKEVGADELEAMEEEDLKQVSGGIVTVTMAVLTTAGVVGGGTSSDSGSGGGGGW